MLQETAVHAGYRHCSDEVSRLRKKLRRVERMVLEGVSDGLIADRKFSIELVDALNPDAA